MVRQREEDRGRERQREAERDDSERLRVFDDGQKDRQTDICNRN